MPTHLTVAEEVLPSFSSAVITYVNEMLMIQAKATEKKNKEQKDLIIFSLMIMSANPAAHFAAGNASSYTDTDDPAARQSHTSISP
eukprot:scaffold485242_cov42-Prasinocladus_malaysianus.AAC.1